MDLRVLLDGAVNLAPTGIRSPDSPGRSESLYQLSYPCSHSVDTLIFCGFVIAFKITRNFKAKNIFLIIIFILYNFVQIFQN